MMAPNTDPIKTVVVQNSVVDLPSGMPPGKVDITTIDMMKKELWPKKLRQRGL
nr:hypothetical protein [uncultured Tateyamaria sp.]